MPSKDSRAASGPAAVGIRLQTRSIGALVVGSGPVTVAVCGGPLAVGPNPGSVVSAVGLVGSPSTVAVPGMPAAFAERVWVWSGRSCL